jgi:hypothetical protein
MPSRPLYFAAMGLCLIIRRAMVAGLLRSAVLDMVPLVGHIAAAPTDTCANVIDPD